MPRATKSPGRRTKTSRSPRTRTRRKSKSLLSQLGAIALFRPLKLSRTQAILAAGAVAVVGIAVIAYSFAASSYSFWSTTTNPSKVATDAQATEVGLKFYPDSNGTIDAVRFYKAKTNTGVHTGTLWSSSGQQLATVTFTSETASGWQTAKFASPVKVTANTNYVISYHTNAGHYSIDNNYFGIGRNRGPLHAPASTSSSPNGVYIHNGTSAFPTTGKQATNFWVDVVFTPDTTPTPSITPTPTSSATPTPPPITGVSSCPLPAYPSPACVGRPSSLGTTYSLDLADGYTITTDGTVADNWHVKGVLVVHAKNVVIKNSQIDKTVYNDDSVPSSYTIMDSNVGPSPIKDATTGALTLTDSSGNRLCNSGGLPSLNGHDITAARVYLYGNQDGIDPGASNVNVTDSLIQPCFLPGGVDGYHSDGVQDQCGGPCGNFTFIHNTFDSRAYYNGTPTGNSAVYLGSPYNGTGNNAYGITFRNNMFMGGGYTHELLWDNVGDKSNWIFDSNVWADGTWTYGPVDAENTCSHMTWTNNSIVTIDTNYNVTATVKPLGCIN